MTRKTLSKWKRDALETQHDLRHEMSDNALAAKRHSKRVIHFISLYEALSRDLQHAVAKSGQKVTEQQK